MHSPAPFRIGGPQKDTKNGGEFRIIKSADGEWIANVRCGSKLNKNNCALFMAAPDVLAACKFMLEFVEPHLSLNAADDPWHIAARRLKEAIARAEGGAT